MKKFLKLAAECIVEYKKLIKKKLVIRNFGM